MTPSFPHVEEASRRLASFLQPFRSYYERAGMEEPFEHYVANVASTLVTGSLATLLALLAVHVFVLKMSAALALAASFVLTLALSAAFAGVALYYPVYKVYSRRVSIEKDLPYTVAYMASLASSGMGLERILEYAGLHETNREIKRELFLVLRDIKALGLDTLTALARLASRSPSAVLTGFVLALREAYATSGDLKSVLMHYSKLMLSEKTQRLRSLINSLSLLAEVYTTMMVAAPLMFITMLIVINILGGGVLGLSPDLLILILTFILLPSAAAGIYVVIDGMLSKV